MAKKERTIGDVVDRGDRMLHEQRRNEVIADNDCEDQGFSLISEGCYHCLPTFKDGKPVRTPLVQVERYGKMYWQCPRCLGYYGPAPLARAEDASEHIRKLLNL